VSSSARVAAWTGGFAPFSLGSGSDIAAAPEVASGATSASAAYSRPVRYRAAADTPPDEGGQAKLPAHRGGIAQPELILQLPSPPVFLQQLSLIPALIYAEHGANIASTVRYSDRGDAASVVAYPRIGKLNGASSSVVRPR
jgi:hypothetical protein